MHNKFPTNVAVNVADPERDVTCVCKDGSGTYSISVQRPTRHMLLATHALDIVEHYADRAGLLIDGRLIREWQKEEIESLRANGGGFDAALAETITR
jgi:hypothetical protein